MKNTHEKRTSGTAFFWELARRSLAFQWRSNILFCAGSAVSAVILIGALLTGSSLKGSIRGLYTPRLGEVKWVLSSAGGHFRASIADSISTYLQVRAAPVQLLTGTANAAGADNSGGGAARVNIIGVDERFWELGPQTAAAHNISAAFRSNTGDISAVVNSALAQKLGIEPGGDIILRFPTAKPLAVDAPFGSQDSQASLRLSVESIADGGKFGDFSLKAEHFTLYNVFVPLKLLQSMNNTPGMAGAILIDKDIPKLSSRQTALSNNNPADADITESANAEYERIISVVQKSLSIRDAGLNLRRVESSVGVQDSAAVGTADAERNADFEIYSGRVFISDTLKGIITRAIPKAVPVSAWFVNEITAASGLSTPYSFVSTPPLEYTLSGNRIAVGDWMARDLVVSVGDSVTLKYFVPHVTSGLRIDSSVFAVSTILYDTVPWLNTSLMPPYPGLADAGGCMDWNPSIPVDLKNIRPEDEEYWEKYRGKPKAVISYDKAKQIWNNRFGVCTAVRIPNSAININSANTVNTESIDNSTNVIDSAVAINTELIQANIESAIAPLLTPTLCGMQLTDVRTHIYNAVNGGMDFAPLFLGLSFFTFAASLLLIWLLSSMHYRSRAEEHTILSAVGYSRKHILLVYMSEGLLIFSIGALAGILLSPFYTLALIAALKSVWKAAAMTPVLNLHIDILSILAGSAAAFACAFISMFIPVFFATGRRFSSSARAPKPNRGTAVQTFDTHRFILLNILRNKRLAIGEAMILACALFILGITQTFHQRTVSDPSQRSCGTGGFLYYGELNSGIPAEQAGAEFLREQGIPVGGINKNTNANINTNSSDFSSVVMRVKDGDDASCLNVNRTNAPALLGTNQNLLDSLGAFSFAATINIEADTGGITKEHPWLVLNFPTEDKKTVYGIADANTIDWGLGKILGDTLAYINELGDTLNVILAASLKNTILQGKVIIAETDFIRNYPSISGYRVLLISAPANLGEAVANAFLSYHGKNGLYLEPAAARLNAFNAVENTYLSIFAILGMMGLALGCAGMGIVVARGIEERRYGLALLMAQGFTIGMIRRILFSEQAAIALAGTLAGLLPVVITFGAALNPASLLRIFFMLLIVILCGAGSILLGLRGLKTQNLLAVLKDEL